MTRKIPHVLLIGLGRFGEKHFEVLSQLHENKRILLKGVIERSPEKKKELEKKIGFPVYSKVTPELLQSVDGVDIVTPYPSHYKLAKECLPYTNVFVEKPLAETAKEAQELTVLAKKHNRSLMVGHIYRYNTLVHKLKKLTKGKLAGARIAGTLINPVNTYRGENPSLEFLHLFDILENLTGKKPISAWKSPLSTKHLLNVSLRYPAKIDTSLTYGWEKNQRERKIVVTLKNGEIIETNFAGNFIKITKKKGGKTLSFKEERTLIPELTAWSEVLKKKKLIYPDGKLATEIIKIANQITNKPLRPRIAVIGAGLFGTTSALELAGVGDVTLFERNKDIMTEASYANQYRHHMGYHYTKSMETIQEIQEATKDFESSYGDSVVRNFPSYYSVVKHGSKISAKEFKELCRQTGLPFNPVILDPEILNPKEVEITVQTDEAGIDYTFLKKDIWKRMRTKDIDVKLRQEVKKIELLSDGTKRVHLNSSKQIDFDYVINATYAHHNTFCEWLGFPPKNLEWRLKELCIVKLPLKNPLAIMLINGPFATFVPIGKTGLYTFGDMPLSIREIRRDKKAMKAFDDKKSRLKTLWPKIQKRCLKWFPMLDKAEYVKSMYVVLPVERGEKADDARPTEVTSHGFGCYSILSGKLITSVTAAKKIVEHIKKGK